MVNAKISARVTEARQRLDDCRQLKAALPTTHEELNRRSLELERIEACMNEVEQRLQALTTFSFAGLLESLAGQKQRKVEEHRALLLELEAEAQSMQPAVDALAVQVAEIQNHLAGLGDAEVEYQSACEEKQQSMIEQGEEGAQQLVLLGERLEVVRAALRPAQKAHETGRQLLRHLESLDRATRNARSNRRMSTAVGGPLGGIVKGAIASLGPKSAIRYVDEGLKRFCRELFELPLGDHPDDTELMRIQAELGAFQDRLSAELSGVMGWDAIETLPIQTDVQAAISILRTLATDLEREQAELEQERMSLIESA